MVRVMFTFVLSLVIVILCSPALLQAQFEKAEIVGTVRDASGAVVAGVTVRIRNVETNEGRDVATDGQGNYGFPDS